jgi:RNA polymerase sigma-70 factor (ECF subfamily)
MDTTDTADLDQADMARLVAGHDTALDALMARHAPAVFRFLYRLLGNADDANDLAQETFVRLFQHRTGFRSGAKLTPWLYTIAGNLARNQHRWRSRHPNVSLDAVSAETDPSPGAVLPAAEASPSEAVMKAERTRAVRAAVQALPDDLRQAIVLCEWEDLSLAEAADVLQTTPKAVESRLYRARQLLRQRLSRWL